jgi:hypothetical protein
VFGLHFTIFYQLFRFTFQIVQVEIVIGLEEEFGISVEEESAQTITTIQEADDMIDKLLETKA